MQVGPGLTGAHAQAPLDLGGKDARGLRALDSIEDTGRVSVAAKRSGGEAVLSTQAARGK